MKKIEPILLNEIAEAVDLAVECFFDDPFYGTLEENATLKKIRIGELFEHSIRICVKEGWAYCIKDCNENIIAFSLWFNYNLLKKSSSDSFNYIFGMSKVGPSRLVELIDREHIGESMEYLYLLAICVKDSFRRKGIASSMVKCMLDAYPQYNVFSDISNPQSINLYKNLGFDIVGKHNECTLIKFVSKHDDIDISWNKNVCLVVPKDTDCSLLWGKEMKGNVMSLPYIKQDSNGILKQDIYTEKLEVLCLLVNYEELLAYQKSIDVIQYEELKIIVDGLAHIVYVSNRNECSSGLHMDERMNEQINRRKTEWEIVPDVYVSIPIRYSNIDILGKKSCWDNFVANRIWMSLKHRTIYESGMPEIGLGRKDFQSRIVRFFLGCVRIGLQTESVVAFNGPKSSSGNIGEPIDVLLFIAVDKLTHCGVLHIISLSCGLFITQLLDSVSRNQLLIKTPEGDRDLYSYIKTEFECEKKGDAKSFVTIPRNRECYEDDILSSILFSETYYYEGESIGHIVDRDIRSALNKPYGIAQYDYASVFAHSNVLLQLSNYFRGSLTERIVTETITLFYIELILFEVSSVRIADDRIVEFLTQIEKFTPKDVLKEVDSILNENVKSIEFLNVRMNYPSSEVSVNNIRNAFRISLMKEGFEKNKEQLLMIYNTRSSIIDRTEATILSSAGIILTTISVVDLIISPDKSPLLCYIALLVGVILLMKRFLYRKILFKHEI